MRQGLQHGEAAVLLRQMERKYGVKAVAAYRERVDQTDSERLLEWPQRVLTAASIENDFR